jgi:hypothetical protein
MPKKRKAKKEKKKEARTETINHKVVHMFKERRRHKL